LAAALVVAAFITINAWTAVAKNENGWKALSAPGTTVDCFNGSLRGARAVSGEIEKNGVGLIR